MTHPGASVTPEMRRQMRGEYTITDEEVLDALAEAARDALAGDRWMVTTWGERIESSMAPARMVAACMWSGDPWGESAHPKYESLVVERLVMLAKEAGVLGFRIQVRANGESFADQRDWWFGLREDVPE